MGDPYIAIDWGTSRRRIYLIDPDGNARAAEKDDCGVSGIKTNEYPSLIASIRRKFGPCPIVAAGMVGSRGGWIETPYVTAPAGIEAIAEKAIFIAAENVTLLPGVATSGAGHADVMRGEETQALGAWISGAAPATALFCQPGTHNKWIHLRDGRIDDFLTVMTGELFSLLRGSGTLAPFLQYPVQDDDSFRAGVLVAQADRYIGAALFRARAATLLGELPAASASSYVSGLLIGSDILAAQSGRERINIIASDELSDLYLSAANHLRLPARRVDSTLAFISGIHMIWKHRQSRRPIGEKRMS